MTMTTKVCPEHNEPLVKVKGKWYCKKCLYNSFLTHQTQIQATKRWRQSDKGKEAEKTYEQSDKGKVARTAYLHSDKYKAARKAYNERLKESLAIARSARIGGSSKITKEETRTASTLEGLLAEIREYLDSNNRPPTLKNVIDTAKRDYNQVINEDRARELIDAALKSRRS